MISGKQVASHGCKVFLRSVVPLSFTLLCAFFLTACSNFGAEGRAASKNQYVAIKNNTLITPQPSLVRAEQNGEFSSFLEEVRQKALAKGLQHHIIDRALKQAKFLPTVIRLDRKQSEFTTPFKTYLNRVVSTSRIQTAQRHMRENVPILTRISRDSGVPKSVILALWGTESNFGRNMGSFSVISSLATLAYEGRRRDFFYKELIAALQILDERHVTPENMKGSWAGAMGQCQFMPSSFLQYAIDGNGDNRVNIWQIRPDVWASIANYLKVHGWKAGQPVSVPVHASSEYINRIRNKKDGQTSSKTLAQWKAAGITPTYDIASLQSDLSARLLVPKRSKNQAFLVFDNFDVLMRWNRSHFFGLAVSELAHKIAGNGV